MKKSFTSFALAAAMCLPTISVAGYYADGRVSVSDRSFYGTMNVRFDTGDRIAFIRAEGGAYPYASARVTFMARDASYKYFYCSVTSDSPLYERAAVIASSLGNGSYLMAYASGGSGSECTFINHQKSSFFMD